LEVWRDLIAYAKQHHLRFHIHLAEIQSEVDDALKKYGKTPVQVFEDLGLWTIPSLAAHSVCLSEGDIAILGKYKVGVSHNIESNLKLATRVAPVVELRRAGCPVAIGTDSTASNNNLDLLQEADFVAKLQTFRYGP